jgi:signal transduction histidine kinase
VALLASFFVARRVVRPLEMLRKGVERIRQGDLAARLDLKTGDEIEVLAEEFNEMAAHLREAYTGLERKVAERTEALTIANEKLEEASTHKSRFLANVNHELRTPVSAIIGYARLVLRATEGRIDPLQRENLQDLLNNAEHLLGMINSLLDLAKIEAGKLEIRREAVDVHQLINGALSMIAPMVKQDRVRLTREIEPNLSSVNTDPEKLKQILVNLLANAAKFTDVGEIKIAACQENGFFRFSVADTGIGIDKSDLDHIFEEFHQGETATTWNRSGTGLGLAIARKFANLLGGDITVESTLGKGSTFTVTLPLNYRESVAA